MDVLRNKKKIWAGMAIKKKMAIVISMLEETYLVDQGEIAGLNLVVGPRLRNRRYRTHHPQFGPDYTL